MSVIRRRTFIAGLGSAVAWPVVARAQQPTMPVVGWLSPFSREDEAEYLNPFRRGLGERGYVEGRNVVVEYRFAEGQYDRMPALAVDLIRLRAAVLICITSTVAVPAALAASSTTPIVFVSGIDPVQVGVVSSLNRPSGNITGVVTSVANMASKQIGLLRELLPKGGKFAVLTHPTNPGLDVWAKDAQAATRSVGIEAVLLLAASAQEIDEAFASLSQTGADALLVAPDPFFNVQAGQIAALAARHGVPTLYSSSGSRFPRARGLISYASNTGDLYRTVGDYAACILKGEKPADLPVQRPTRFELVINLKTAEALGLTIPETLLATADEVIQ
jgi:putative tryptophan/tyrosine transport system substrate-binding protein